MKEYMKFAIEIKENSSSVREKIFQMLINKHIMKGKNHRTLCNL